MLSWSLNAVGLVFGIGGALWMYFRPPVRMPVKLPRIRLSNRADSGWMEGIEGQPDSSRGRRRPAFIGVCATALRGTCCSLQRLRTRTTHVLDGTRTRRCAERPHSLYVPRRSSRPRGRRTPLTASAWFLKRLRIDSSTACASMASRGFSLLNCVTSS
jgi:hypothetical protein